MLMDLQVKRVWDEHHTVANWSFKKSCSETIFHLLNDGGVDVSNYVHLARLFVNQLIVSCVKGLKSSMVYSRNLMSSW